MTLWGGGGVPARLRPRRPAPAQSRARRRRRFVDDEPEESQRLDRLGEVVELYRLSDEAVRAEGVAAYDVLVLLRRRQNDDRQQARAVVGADAPDDLEPAEARQGQGEQHHLRHGGQVAPRV